MKAIEIIDIIEKTAPLAAQSHWDKCGVQVAALREQVCHVGVTLDPSLEQLEKAHAAGVDFLLTHHPLSLKPRFPDRADDYLRMLTLLVTHCIWLYSAHTSLDAAPNGPARWLATELGLCDIAVLEQTSAYASGEGGSGVHGFGFVGSFPVALPYAAFTAKLGAALGKTNWQACGPCPVQVGRVACCPGSGSELVQNAQALGAQVLITGDVKYHAALEAPLRVLDVGHFVLEEEMMRRFARHLSDLLPVPVTFFPAADPLQQEVAG